MARVRTICVSTLLASAMISRPAGAQGTTTSLTHTVSVTVPPRIRVTVANSTAGAKATGLPRSPGLSLRINATQAWSLSIDAPRNSKLQWSRDGESPFIPVDGPHHGTASATPGPAATATTIIVRSGTRDSSPFAAADGDIPTTVLLTIVAQ